MHSYYFVFLLMQYTYFKNSEITLVMTDDNLRQAMSSVLQFTEGTHKFEEPVSKMTLNFCPGVPIKISP